MKILYISTSFPRVENGSTIYTDLAEALTQSGHELMVVVADNNMDAKSTQIDVERGYEVLRVGTGKYYNVGLIRKGINSLVMPSILKNAIKNNLSDRQFDVILYESPPVTNYNAIKWAKKNFNAKTFLMLKDIFPQNAVDLGMFSTKSPIYLLYKSLEKKLYQISDVIGCMSPANMNYLKNEFPEFKNKIKYFPNTKKIISKEEFSDLSQVELREDFGLKPDQKIFLFGGNMGKPQYIELLLDTIKHYKDDDRIQFIFIGRGTDRKFLEEAVEAHAIENVKISDNLPRDRYEEILSFVDVGLILLNPKFSIPNYPSRILSYMEYAKPVLAATDLSTDIKDLIEAGNFGFWTHSLDHQAFISKIDEILEMNHSELLEMGKNGRDYIEKHFSLKVSMDLFQQYLKNGEEANVNF